MKEELVVTGKEMEDACSGPASARLCGLWRERWKEASAVNGREAGFPRNLERGGTGDMGGWWGWGLQLFFTVLCSFI